MSADVGLGIVHNWISYSMLLSMIASVTNLIPGELTYYVNDLHIYNNHMDKLLALPQKSFSVPDVCYTVHENIDNYTLDDFELVDYKSGPKVTLEMAV